MLNKSTKVKFVSHDITIIVGFVIDYNDNIL